MTEVAVLVVEGKQLVQPPSQQVEEAPPDGGGRTRDVLDVFGSIVLATIGHFVAEVPRDGVEAEKAPRVLDELTPRIEQLRTGDRDLRLLMQIWPVSLRFVFVLSGLF